jgi:DNA mismatch endonuclease (patch repair protein)
MADIFSKEKRSATMARVRSLDNRSTERRLIAIFRANRISGWRRNSKLFGRPDFVFPRDRIALFVDGDFWHGHPVLFRLPRQNQDYWRNKITRNRERDRLVNRTLRSAGWRVLRIWEHQLTIKREARVVARLRRWLASGRGR